MIVQNYAKLNHIQSLLVALRAGAVLIFTKIPDLQAFLTESRAQSKTIGFVPTMGALHEGHISLIKASANSCSLTICSIFVNPTQFNNPEDLKRYPRMPEKDAKMLEKEGCDVLFLPSVQEMYPTGGKEEFHFGNQGKVLEGAFRPGHFNGVAQVVKRFFEIIGPAKAFFGSKDYQQVLIVQDLVKQLRMPVEIIACPTKREADGLAMSSRNTLLTADERATASIIPTLINEAAKIARVKGVEESKKFVQKQINSKADMKLDYFEICDPESLQSISDLKKNQQAVALIAVYVGKIRLIDNLIFN
jgi:pantoate--beta-alanine ligase